MVTRNERGHVPDRMRGAVMGIACLLLAALTPGPAAAQEAAPAAAPAPAVPAPEAAPAGQPAATQATPAAPSAGGQAAPAAPAAAEPVAAGSAPSSQAGGPPAGTESLPADVPAEADGDGSGGIQIAHNLPSNLSPWGMFLAADIVVKAVMVGLAFASLVTWTVWLSKSLELGRARLLAAKGVAALSRSATLGDAARELEGRRGAVAALVRAAGEEVTLSSGAIDHAGGGGLKERVASRLGRVEAGAARRMTRGTGLLATIGSTAPFVGLFGTVWGIMNSFIGISESQTTNLAIVAPGIAEALLATAIGLVAAIPAVVIYNLFARATAAYRQILSDASAAVERLVSRDLDFRAVPREHRMAAE